MKLYNPTFDGNKKEPIKEESQDKLVREIINIVLIHRLAGIDYKTLSTIKEKFTITRNKQ